MRLYGSLRSKVAKDLTEGKSMYETQHEILLTPEAGPLCGYQCANNDHTGLLTRDQSVRLHSCEAGTECVGVGADDVVWITPIITRTENGTIVEEVGAGGGAGDLAQTHELDLNDPRAVQELLDLCSHSIHDRIIRKRTVELITDALFAPSKKMPLAGLDDQSLDSDIPLESFTNLLQKAATKAIVDAEKEDASILSEQSKPQPAYARTIVNPTCTYLLEMILTCGSNSPIHDILHTVSCVTLSRSSSQRTFTRVQSTKRAGVRTAVSKTCSDIYAQVMSSPMTKKWKN